MEHLSSETLTELALGHADVRSEHLDACDLCRGEVAALRTVLHRVRRADVEPVTPPAGLWDRIAAEVDEAPRAAELDQAPHAAEADQAPRADEADQAPQAVAARRRSDDVASRGSRRRFSVGALLTASLASAAVAALVVGVIVSQLGTQSRANDVASAVLEPLRPNVAAASAEVIEVDGQRLLVVDAAALPEVDGYLDVWLLDENAQQMVSLGVMEGESIRLALPEGLDLGTFPIVDVSIEPFDGDPTHSGNSLWRGALES